MNISTYVKQTLNQAGTRWFGLLATTINTLAHMFHHHSAFKKLFLVCFLFIASCTEIRLIGDYDPTVDESIQRISKEVTTLLVEVEKNQLEGKAADNAYENFRRRYIDLQGDAQTLQIRTHALPKYQIIAQQVTLLNDNIKLLDSLHRTGIAAPGRNPLPVIKFVRDRFDTAFTSMLRLQNALKREKLK